MVFLVFLRGGVLKPNLLQLIFYRHLQKNFYDVIRIAVVMRHRLSHRAVNLNSTAETGVKTSVSAPELHVIVENWQTQLRKVKKKSCFRNLSLEFPAENAINPQTITL